MVGDSPVHLLERRFMIRARTLSREGLLLLGGAVVAGSALRLYQIRDQLLVSDEWHALHASAKESLFSLLSLVTMGATSIPLNLYSRLLLDSVGWSELALRLPSLVAGIGTLFVFPLLVRDLFRPRTTVLFAYLIAVSPSLVFYSRYFRPYSVVVLLTFVSLIACYRWAISGRLRHAVLFVGSGVMAAYFHVTEVRSIFLPLFLLVVLKMFARSDRINIRPSIVALLLAGLVSVLPLALLFLPGFLAAGQFLSPVVGQARLDVATLLAMSELMSGTSLPLVHATFVGLAALGFVFCFRQDRLLAALLLAIVLGSVGMVFLVRPLGSDIPVVFTRYVIAILPVVLIAVANGVDGVLERAERMSPFTPRWTQVVVSCAAAGGVTALFWLGPLPSMYSGRNDFTNHKVFQGSYTALARANRDQTTGAPLVPAFYDRLAAEDGCDAVIEYPLLVGDVNSPYFLHQARHQKRVLGGYFHTPDQAGWSEQPGIVGGSWIVDHVLLEVTDPGKLRFRNLVNLGDPAAVRASGACYLIVHSHPTSEIRGKGAPRHDMPARPPDYAQFGQPVYSDALVTVFDLRRSPS